VRPINVVIGKEGQNQLFQPDKANRVMRRRVGAGLPLGPFALKADDAGL